MSLLPESLQKVVTEGAKQKRSLDSLAPLYGAFRNLGFFVLLLTQMVMCGRVSTLQNTNAPAFVQSVNGDGIPIEAKDSYYRSEETIQSFLREWLPLALNWSGEIIDDNGKPQKDIGQSAGGVSVPSGPFVASFALQPGFAESWASGLVKNYKLDQYLTNGKTRTVVISYLGKPKIENQGKKISVRVIATWLEKSNKDKEYPIAYEYYNTFVLTPVDKPVSALKKNATPFEKSIYSVLARGLRITDIVPIKFN